ncbi:hypothetical protein HWV62_11309 [Athelia sp. TMB]|nr:hypothetical protein HWV62_11309 [Athelia sp. TMB]
MQQVQRHMKLLAGFSSGHLSSKNTNKLARRSKSNNNWTHWQEEELPAKKPRPLRNIIDGIKAERLADKERSISAKQQSENMDIDIDGDTQAVQDVSHTKYYGAKLNTSFKFSDESTDEDELPAPVLAKKKSAPLKNLFSGSATHVKREKAVAPVEDGSDDDIEIVEENLRPQPRPTKSQSKSKGKGAVKPDWAIDSGEEQSAFINNWQDNVVEPPKRAAVKRRSGASKATTPALTSGTSKHSQPLKAPSSSQTALSNQVKIKNYQDDTNDDSDGLLSEKDERQAGHKFVTRKNQGVKHQSGPCCTYNSLRVQALLKSFVTTATTFKSEESDIKPFSATLVKKPSGKVTNKHLPVGYLANGAWRIVILSFFRFITTTMEVFNVTEGTMVFALTTLSSVIYGPTGINMITITPSSVPFRLRLSDSWRTIIGSAAIAALTAFFDSSPKFNSDQRRMKFAQHLYEYQCYLYKYADGEDKNHFKGLFHNSFVISTFAAHLNIISGSQEVLELYAPQGVTHKDRIPKARGALALCGVAVMRTVALYATGGITLSSLKDEKASANKQLTFPVFIPPISKTEIRDKTTCSSAFSASSWAAPTAYLAKACYHSITDEDMDSIVKEAKEIVRASHRQAREADSDLDPDNSLLHLGNGSSSDGENTMDVGAPEVDDSEPEEENNDEDDDDDNGRSSNTM